MPVLRHSFYCPPLFLRNGHLQTIYPNLFRSVEDITYRRQRIETPDGDFLDLDWSSIGARRGVVLAHGLEGNATRPYILGMVRALNHHGWDAVAWNFRGCSGQPNRKLRFYHSGDTPDLHTVLTHALKEVRYEHFALIGFSLGGNVILKYLGEQGRDARSRITAAVTFSVPCDLAGSAHRMARLDNIVYMKRFMRLLREKIQAKMKAFPGEIDDRGYERMRTFEEFDERYTAPLHGFKSAYDYWAEASSKPFLPRIAVPTLLVNALDDPFLSPSCFPYEEAALNPHLFLETPATGGHVGFASFKREGEYWSESRALAFLRVFARIQL
jgi:uncharacterized protein